MSDNAPSRADTSFKWCVCLLLLFIAICVVVLLAATKWNKDEPRNQNEGKPTSEESKGSEEKPNKPITKSPIVTKQTTVKNLDEIKPKPTDIPKERTKDDSKEGIVIVTESPTNDTKTWGEGKGRDEERTTEKVTVLPKKDDPKEVVVIVTETPKNDKKKNVTKTWGARKGGDEKATTEIETLQSASIVTELPIPERKKNDTKIWDADKRRDQEETTESVTIAPKQNKKDEGKDKDKDKKREDEVTTQPPKPDDKTDNPNSGVGVKDRNTSKKGSNETTTEIVTEPSRKDTKIIAGIGEDKTTNKIVTEQPKKDVPKTSQKTEVVATTEMVTKVEKDKTPEAQTTIESVTETPKKDNKDQPKTRGEDKNKDSTTLPPKTDADGQKLLDEYEYEDLKPKNTTLHLLVKNPELPCPTAACKKAASRMLRLMDHSVDPCTDFYEYSCGGKQHDNTESNTWRRLSKQTHNINEGSPSYQKKFKTFYDSCVTHEHEFDYMKRIDGVLKLVKEVGGILHEKPPAGTIDMTNLFADLILRQSLPFIEIDIDIDKQTSAFILKLTLPKPTSVLKERGRWSALTEAQKRCLDNQRDELERGSLDLTGIYEAYLACQKDHTIYLNSVETVARSLGFYSHLNNTYNENQRIQELRTTIEWDILEHLNTLPNPSEIRQTMLFKNYTIHKISDLQIQHSFLQWNKLFSKVVGRTLPDGTLVQVYFPSYFTNILQKLKETDDWKLNNALIAIYANNLYENLVIPQAKHTRENYCLKLSSKLFPDISSNLYMKTWLPSEIQESQQFLSEIFERLKKDLTSAFEKEEWLDEDSETRAILKLKKMKLTFNKQSDSYNDEKILDGKYNPVDISEDFQENAVKMLITDRKMRYALVGKTYSTDDLWSYFINAFDTVPMSFYSKELILAPLGMVKNPVRGLPGYITMGQIGLSLAKEIGRHFDPVGIENGMTLTAEAETFYEELKINMKSESLFDVKARSVGHQTVGYKVDPILSVNERIAENTGFRLISDSFANFSNQNPLPWVLTSFSIERIFYITVAQEYCQKTDMPEFMQQLFESEILPASLRVENIVTNSNQFSKAFKCPTGTPMNDNPNKMQFPHLQEYEHEES